MALDTADLIHSFVEDCREHLDSIEASLMDIEAAGEHQNPELVNSVFRLAHSIKGGAGMLGLDNIKTLAHKLENVLHMVRSSELVPTKAVVEVLLKGFDKLTHLVDNIEDSENIPIDVQVAQLLAISQAAEGGVAQDLAPAQFRVGSASIFSVDALSLAQAKSGGNELYLLEFDLIHDIHGKGHLPFEVLKALNDTGRIVDCKVDFVAVGDLDAFGNSIPFYVLYATILEPKYVSGLVKLPDDRVRHLDEVPNAVSVAPPSKREQSFGALVLRIEQEAGTLVLPEEITPPVLADLRLALLEGLEHCTLVTLDLGAVSHCDVFFHQMLVSAQGSYAKRSKRLLASGSLAGDLRQACAVQGFACDPASGSPLPAA